MTGPLFLAGIATAPVTAETARRILEGLLGLDHAPGFDAELARGAAAEAVEDLMGRDLERALFVRSAARAAEDLRRAFRMPHDIGYRREAVKLARKIFEDLTGRRVRGAGPIVSALLAAGARPATGMDAEILVVTDADDAASASLAFEIEGRAPNAAYRFTRADLDAASFRETARLLPRDAPARIGEAAAEVARRALGPAPAPGELEPLIHEIRDGVRPKYADHEPSEQLFARLVSERLKVAASDPAEARLLGEFLGEIASAKRGNRSRR